MALSQPKSFLSLRKVYQWYAAIMFVYIEISQIVIISKNFEFYKLQIIWKLKHNKKKISLCPEGRNFNRILLGKKDFARSETTKQSPKNNRNAKEINCHELFENPGEIASLRSQNPYIY